MELRLPLSPPQIIDGITLKFPAKLWRIVNSCKTGSIAWETGGKSIRIQRKQFEQDYLSSSLYFKTTNFPSFIRQLNIYGFRKVPTTNRWQENGTVFEYKHDFFIKGHPELLSEVRRNTAVRRTQKEAAFRENEDALVQSQVKFQNILKKAKQAMPEHDERKRKVDNYHPLLKGPPSILKYDRSQQEPMQQLKHGNITTVYMTPRGTALCDMPTISPSRLQDQVLGLLPSINGSDDEDMLSNRLQLPDYTMGGDSPNFQTKNDGILGASSILQQDKKPIKNPILFLPSAGDSGFDLTNLDNMNIDKFSQDSNCSNINKELMFGCPIAKDDDYDELEKSLSSSFDLSDDSDFLSPDNEKHDTSSLSISKTIDLTGPDSDMDSLSLSMADTLAHLGEEQGFLTPAYFDPGTGTVTLLLPPLCSEA